MAENNNEETRYFQYLTTDRRGDIVEYNGIEVEDDIVYVKFKDGSRVKEDFILPLGERNPRGNTVMAEIDNPKNRWQFKEIWVGRQEEKWAQNANGEKVCVQPFIPGRKKIKLIPPKNINRPKKSKFGGEIVYVNENNENQQQLQQSQQPQQSQQNSQQPQQSQQNSQSMQQKTIDTTDPVYIMMEKAKKYDTEIPVSLTISLPTKSLYDVAKESFENGGKKVVEYIISNIDDSKLKQNLKDALYEAYEDDASNYEDDEEANQFNNFEQFYPKDNEEENINKEEGPTKSNIKKNRPNEKRAEPPKPTKPQNNGTIQTEEVDESSQIDPSVNYEPNPTNIIQEEEIGGTTLFEPEVEQEPIQGEPQMQQSNNSQ